jgi:predicted dehydrogenase
VKQPIGIGLIGLGGIAQKAHLPAYRVLQNEGLARIAAVCDQNVERTESTAKEYGVEHAVTDYRELLALPGVDAVDICTPNSLHMPIAVDAFAAGKHVLCEKPIGRSAEEGRRMLAAEQASGRKLMVGLNLRYAPGPVAIKRFVDDGKLGQIYYARAQALRRRGIPTHGVFTDKEIQGGGPLIDIGVHILDLTLWMMGYPKPVSVTGSAYTEFGRREGGVNLRGSWDATAYTVEDLAAGFVRFENGASLSLESSFAANIERDIFRTHLFGTEGGAVVDPFESGHVRIFREESGALTDTSLPFLARTSFYEDEIRGFLEAIRDDRPVPIPSAQALTVTEIIDALYRSAESGREVQL